MTELEMARVRSYVRLIDAKRRTIDDVPELYREEVEKYIKEQQAK